MYIKNISLFFHGSTSPHSTQCYIKMADALAGYVSNYKFQFKFNLKPENRKFEEKKQMCF